MNATPTIAFTICSINYLAQAITLGDSLYNTNPEIEFRIYLVDKIAGREEIIESVPFPLIEIENVPVADFSGMCVRYNITELNTSVKPFIIDHIFRSEPHITNIIYFDPDIVVFGSLKELLNNLTNHTIVLTPHILKPSEEHPFGQSEKNYLIAGVYNLGFIGVSRGSESLRFLKWWQDRLVHQGYGNNEMHLFYDQKWLNLAPVFFDDVYVEKSPGYNMAGWNLHEREITAKHSNDIIINHDHKLIFYHFSGVKVSSQNISNYSRYTFEARPDLFDIISMYRNNLINNGNDFYSKYECYYAKLYKGMTVYYPRYHWITIYRRARVKLGQIKRDLLCTVKTRLKNYA